MLQSKLGSFYEAVINTAVGFCLSAMFQVFLAHVYHYNTTFGQNMLITGYFTVLSVARGYLLRRFFNAQLKAIAQRMAGDAQ